MWPLPGFFLLIRSSANKSAVVVLKVYNGAKHQACGGSKRWSRNDGSTRRTSSFEVALTFRAIQRVQIDSILTVMDAEQILSFDRR